MGDCYSAYIKCRVKDPAAFVEKSKAMFRRPLWGEVRIAPDCYEKGDETTPRGIIGIVMAEVHQPRGFTLLRSGTNETENRFEATAGFDASYSWGLVLDLWWRAIEDTLEDGSLFDVDSDETRFHYIRGED